MPPKLTYSVQFVQDKCRSKFCLSYKRPTLYYSEVTSTLPIAGPLCRESTNHWWIALHKRLVMWKVISRHSAIMVSNNLARSSPIDYKYSWETDVGSNLWQLFHRLLYLEVFFSNTDAIFPSSTGAWDAITSLLPSLQQKGTCHKNPILIDLDLYESCHFW